MIAQFKVVMDVAAVDNPSRALRSGIVYNEPGISYGARIQIKTCVDETTIVASVTELYCSAGRWVTFLMVTTSATPVATGGADTKDL